MNWQNIFRAMGRGLLEVLRVLVWVPVSEVVTGSARGLGKAAERIAPLAVGSMVVLGVMAFAPELFGMVLVILIMGYGLKVMVRGLLPTPKKKGK